MELEKIKKGEVNLTSFIY